MDPEDRFAFGRNWRHFLQALDRSQIEEAETSLRTMLDEDCLRDKRFLDIGSGSGLFSLAARRLGACVHSFDYDPESVACTTELKQCYFPDDPLWQIEQGSAIDATYMSRLGQFDIVYAWGVLHHTGAMWLGIDLAAKRVTMGGRLYISIYNDQGTWLRIWWLIKKGCHIMPNAIQSFY